MMTHRKSTGEPNLLLLYPRSPLPITSGLHVHEFELMRWLSRYYQITLLAQAHSDAELASRQELLKYCQRVELVPSIWRRYRWLIPLAQSISLFHGIDYMQQERRFGPVKHKLLQILREEKFDVAVAHIYQIASYFFRYLPTSTIKVVNTADIFFERELDRDSKAGFPLNLPVLERRRRLRKEREIDTLSNSDIIIAVTKKDQATLRQALHNPVQVVYAPAVLDLASVKPQWGPETNQDILSVIPLQSLFNEDAFRFLINEIWPQIKKRAPEVRLTIVSADMPGRLAESLPHDPNLLVKGYLSSSELDQEYIRAAAVLVTVRGGSGIKTKVITAMAHGKAVVSTPAGVEGLEVENGVHLMVADDPEDYAERTIRVLQDLELRERVKHQARSFIEKNFTQEKIYSELAQALCLKDEQQKVEGFENYH